MRATPRPCNTGGWQNAGEGQGDEGKREKGGEGEREKLAERKKERKNLKELWEKTADEVDR